MLDDTREPAAYRSSHSGENEMSHEIDITTGRPAFAFDAREGGAWHALGVAIPENEALDPVAIAARVGASYRVHKTGVQADIMGRTVTVKNREALYRDDTGEVLEILSGNKYNVVQPVEYFEAFRDSLKANDLHISSAGVLKGGRIVFVNAKLHDSAHSVLGIDKLESFLCMGGGYDGTMSSFGYLRTFRTVCWNTLSANVYQAQKKGGKSGLFRIPHSAPFDGKVLGAALGLAGEELAARADVFNTLAGRKATAAAVAKYFCDLLDIDQSRVGAVDASGKALLSTKLTNQLQALSDAYLSGPGAELATANGTWFGALNAVTHFVDHLAGTRDSYKDNADTARYASAKFGAGNAVKNAAFKMAMQNAGMIEAVAA